MSGHATNLERRFKLDLRRRHTLEPFCVKDSFAITRQVLERAKPLARETSILLHYENCQRRQTLLPAVVHDATEHFSERAGTHADSVRNDGVGEYLSVVGCGYENLPRELSPLCSSH